MKTRREFLKSSALMTAAAVAGSVGAPKFSFGQTFGGKTLIKVFMRGGADGLHLMPAYGDTFYYQYRPNLGIEPPSADANSAINIGDSRRGLNPNLEPLMEIWDAGRMMFSPSTALDEGNRSHFDCQRWIGTGAQNNIIDGYLNRYMQNTSGGNHPLRGVVAGKTSISTEIRGEIGVPAVSTGASFDLRNADFCSGSGCSDNQLTELMREIASHQVDLAAAETQVRENQMIMIETIDEIRNSGGANYTPSAGGLDYSNSSLGRGLRLMAQLLKAGVPVECAALDWNIGWDTHSNQIAFGNDRFSDQNFSYHSRMREGATDFVTFYRDMGADMNDVVVLVGTEFGRTVRENGSRGSDHGHGGVWFAYGGPTQRRVANDVSTLDLDVLQRRDSLPDHGQLPRYGGRDHGAPHGHVPEPGFHGLPGSPVHEQQSVYGRRLTFRRLRQKNDQIIEQGNKYGRRNRKRRSSGEAETNGV